MKIPYHHVINLYLILCAHLHNTENFCESDYALSVVSCGKVLHLGAT